MRTVNCGSTTPAPSAIRPSANGCSQSGTTKGPFLVFPSSALAHPRSRIYRKNIACATQVFRAAGADYGQSDDSLENAGTLYDAHVLAQKQFFQEKRLSILAASDGRVTKTTPSSLAPYTFFIRKVFFDRIIRRPLHLSHLRWRLTSLSPWALWWSLLQPVQCFIQFYQFKDVH